MCIYIPDGVPALLLLKYSLLFFPLMKSLLVVSLIFSLVCVLKLIANPQP